MLLKNKSLADLMRVTSTVAAAEAETVSSDTTQGSSSSNHGGGKGGDNAAADDDGKHESKLGCKETLDEISRRISGTDRIVLGWGGIDNYYKIVPPRTMTRIKEIHRDNTLRYRVKKAIQAEELLNTLREIEAEDAAEHKRAYAPSRGGVDGAGEARSTRPHGSAVGDGTGAEGEGEGEGDEGEDGGGGGGGGRGGGSDPYRHNEKEGGIWKQIYGIELVRTAETLPEAEHAAALADSDPDNLVYQRRSEESASAAIEALVARNHAEKAIAAKAAAAADAASSRRGRGRGRGRDRGDVQELPAVRVEITEGIFVLSGKKGNVRIKSGDGASLRL